MRTRLAGLLLASVWLVGRAFAQPPLSHDDALKQIYRGYDAATGKAPWDCKDQPRAQVGQRGSGWACIKENETVSVAVEMAAEVREGGVDKVYVVTSAAPKDAPAGYECHACAPAIGMTVFAWQAGSWKIESSNAAVGFFGVWGNTPTIDLVSLGPQKHGVMLTTEDVAQGDAWSMKRLLAPVGPDVKIVWLMQDESDNEGAVDPTDKSADQAVYRAAAGLRFYAGEDVTMETGDYFELEVTSRGQDRVDNDHPMKNENWTEVYRFKDGKYGLVQRTVFVETPQTAAKKTAAK